MSIHLYNSLMRPLRAEAQSPSVQEIGFTTEFFRCPVLRHLAENSGLNFGVYAKPLITGALKIGDKVLLLD